MKTARSVALGFALVATFGLAMTATAFALVGTSPLRSLAEKYCAETQDRAGWVGKILGGCMSAQLHAGQTGPGVSRKNYRIRFAYRGDEIRIVSTTLVTKTAPGDARIAKAEPGPRSGAWFTVQDPRAEVGWERGFRQPNRSDQEVFNEDGTLTRVERRTVEGEFELLVPVLAPDAVVVLYLSPSKAPEKAAKPRLKVTGAELERLAAGGRPAEDHNPDDEGSGAEPTRKPKDHKNR